MPRRESERAFPFDGDDPQYIQHLERLVRSLQRLLNSHAAKDVSISDTTRSPACGTRFIEWQPEQSSVSLSPTWMKQLVAFIAGIPGEDRWQEARVKAGIDTPYRNYQALKLILGHADPAIFHDEYEIAAQPSAPPLGSVDLVARGCEYGRFIARCSHDQNFAVSVVAFQHLVFCSYCVVMMRAGVSQETTNATMRRYTGKRQKDHTLEKYRNGAVWANRCIAFLLENGWGHKSWEIFLLNSQSPAQIARFAAYDADSYKIVAHQLGQANVPLWETGWVPYCLPCIVNYLTGYTIPLEDICNILGYGRIQPALMQATSIHFIESLKPLLTNNDILPSSTGGELAELNVPLP